MALLDVFLYILAGAALVVAAAVGVMFVYFFLEWLWKRQW